MRKRRTREHVIADLSVNNFERFVLRCGHIADRPIFDYGYDLTVRTFDAVGEIEVGFWFVQLKASYTLAYNRDRTFVSYAVDRRDAALWASEQVPVIFVTYDSVRDIAYWIHFQAVSMSPGGTIRIPTHNVVGEESVETMRRLKNEAVSRR